MKKKRKVHKGFVLALSGLLLCFFVLFATRRWVADSALKWAVHHVMPSWKHCLVHIEDIRFEKRGITFYGIGLKSKEEEAAFLRIPSLACRLGYDHKMHRTQMCYQFEGLAIDVASLPPFPFSYSQLIAILHFLTKHSVAIHDGSLYVKSGETPIAFEAIPRSHHLLSLRVHEGEREEALIDLALEGKHINAICHLENLDLHHYGFFFPYPIEGSVNGWIQCALSESLHAHLAVKNVSCIIDKVHMSSEKMQLHIDWSRPPQSWNEVLVNGACEGLKMTWRDGALFHSGTLHVSQRHADHPELHLEGILTQGDLSKHLDLHLHCAMETLTRFRLQASFDKTEEVTAVGELSDFTFQADNLSPFVLNLFLQPLDWEVLTGSVHLAGRVQGQKKLTELRMLLYQVTVEQGGHHLVEGLDAEVGFIPGEIIASRAQGKILGRSIAAIWRGPRHAVTFHVDDESYPCSGQIAFQETEWVVDGQVGEKLAFQIHLDRSRGILQPILPQDLGIRFAGQNLSEPFYSPLLAALHVPWHLKGGIDIQGAWLKTYAVLNLTPLALSWESEGLMIHLPALTRQPVSTLSWDIRDKQWKGQIAFQKGECHFRGLTLSDIALTFDIEKKTATITQGQCACTKMIQLTHLSCHLIWNRDIQVDELKAVLCFGNHCFELMAPYLCWQEGALDFDLRVLDEPHDLFRLKGLATMDNEQLRFQIDRECSYFLSSKWDVFDLSFTADYTLASLALEGHFLAEELTFCLDLLVSGGLLTLPPQISSWGKEHLWQGNIQCAFQKDRHFSLLSDMLTMDQKGLGPLDLYLRFQGDQLILERGVLGPYSALFTMQRSQGGYAIQSGVCHFRENAVEFTGGHLDTTSCQCDIVGAHVDLKGLARIPTSLQGKVEMHGTMAASWKEKVQVDANITFHAKKLGRQRDYTLSSCQPMHFAYLQGERFQLDAGHFSLRDSEEGECAIDCSRLVYNQRERTCIGTDCRLMIPPEVLLNILDQEEVASVQVIGNRKLQLGECLFDWENQLEMKGDFVFSADHFSADGYLKEGYYWIAGHSWQTKKIAFHCKDTAIELLADVAFGDLSFTLSADADFGLAPAFHFTLAEPGVDNPLTCSCRYLADEGFQIVSIEGELLGLSCHFTRSPRPFLPHQMILSGQLLIDMGRLVPTLPKLWREKGKALGLGSGFELSGDLVLNLGMWEHSYFKGFLKGRDFIVKKCVLKTLFSAIDINGNGIFLYDCRLSDRAGVATITHLDCIRRTGEVWELQVPEIAIQDFRPSLLHWIDRPQESLKPFVIKELTLYNLHGILGRSDTFTGTGSFDFFNTFKRDLHLIDIPLDIIGRFGLDLGLFVPVKGTADYRIADGQIFFTQLTRCYSDGERSEFYLSPVHPSTMAFDGTLSIDIKMKQYVLLKLTQSFTVAIRGNVLKPKFSLK